MALSFRGLTAALFLSFLATSGQTQTTHDFLIVQRVDGLVLYNRYQQKLTDSERGVLLPFVPMRILDRNGLLGDGFTRCMHVEVEGEMMYLLTDDSGKPIRNGPPGFERTFTGTTLLSDTVEILRGTPAFVSPAGSTKGRLAKGDKLVRRFLGRQGTYGKILGDSPKFGWIDFSSLKEGKDWKTLRGQSFSSSIPAGVAEKIRVHIGEVNRTWSDLFDYFNERAHQDRPPPSWAAEFSDTSITCTLLGANPDQVRQSTLYILKDIENIVLGAGLTVTHQQGRITIGVRHE
jgi:hypothetical protein